MKQEKALVILAAGMGSRFGGLKQMEGLGPSGETLLEYSVYDAIRAGFTEVIFVIRKSFSEAFESQLSSKFSKRIRVLYAHQELTDLPLGFECPADRQKPWGTGHALLSARKLINKPFAVINADDFYGYDAFEKLATELDSYVGDTIKGCLVAYAVENTLSINGPVSRGLIETKAGKTNSLVSITEYEGIECSENSIHAKSKTGESKSLVGGEWVSVNCFGFHPKVIPLFEDYFKAFLGSLKDMTKGEFYLPTATTESVRDGRLSVDVIPSSSAWKGVTYREDRDEVVQTLKKWVDEGVYPQRLW